MLPTGTIDIFSLHRRDDIKNSVDMVHKQSVLIETFGGNILTNFCIFYIEQKIEYFVVEDTEKAEVCVEQWV